MITEEESYEIYYKGEKLKKSMEGLPQLFVNCWQVEDEELSDEIRR